MDTTGILQENARLFSQNEDTTMNLQFQVNKELCIGCGECAADCPFQLIEMQEDMPVISRENEQNCVQCQHCLAVCSTGALSILGLDPADSLPLGGSPVPPAQLAVLMQGRRSVRRYKAEAVSRADLDFLINTVSYAPTGVNNRMVAFTVIDDPQVMDKVREQVYARLREINDANAYPAGMEYLQRYIVDGLENNRDTIFRNAPHMLIASAPTTSPSPEVDCHIALSYFELLAASMGLGTVWCGLAKSVLMLLTPEILQKLGIPEGHRIGYMMMFGKPDVTYHRTIQREPMQVNRVRQVD